MGGFVPGKPTIATGTQTAPGFYYLDDVDTGFYFPAGGGIGASVDGAPGMFISGANGLDNTGFGYASLSLPAVTGSNNSGFGRQALARLAAGNDNAGFGFWALRENLTGVNSSAFGSGALQNSLASGNSALGTTALYDVTTGANNSALGKNTGRGITTGAGNTIIGANVGGLAAGLTNNIILADGDGAIRGRFDGTKWTFANDNVIFRVYNAASQSISSGVWTKMLFDTEITDTNSNFTNSTFTATIAGYYHFDAVVDNISASATGTALSFYKTPSGGAAAQDWQGPYYPAAGLPRLVGGTDVYLGIGDKYEAYVYIIGVTPAVNGTYLNSFTGHLIRPA